MRVTTRGVAAPRSGATFDFAGSPVAALPGEPLGAALLAAGRRVCRTTPSGGPRGLFCGIGVCQECLVTVDGVPNERACMTAARPGAAVERQPPFAERAPPHPELAEHDRSMDLLVIGGGPAGLAAASVAAEAGLDVVLVDERGKLGGQYYKQPPDAFAVDDARADRQLRSGRAMIRRTRESGASVLSGVTIWAAPSPTEVMGLGEAASYLFRPRRLIIATGAYDQAVPMPGWTLPGFMTTGAAQTLLRAYQVAPGERVVISGNGPLNVQLAAELTRAGVTVAALAELAPAPGLRSAPELAAMLANAPDLLADGLGYLRTLRRAGVRVLHGHSVVAASGAQGVARATVARIDAGGRPVPGTERVLDADAVCVGFGFLPSSDLARALGCRHRFDERRGHLVTVRDRRGRTSVDGVSVAGDGGAIGGARVAGAQGVLAAVDAARCLGAGPSAALAREARRAERTLRRERRFQRALWALYDAPLIVDQLSADDTQICRCEEVTRATIRQAVDGGVRSLGALKRVTRAGMGLCQGRYCAATLAGMLAAHDRRARGELDFFAPRSPFKPVRIGHVAPGRFTGSAMARRGREGEGSA